MGDDSNSNIEYIEKRILTNNDFAAYAHMLYESGSRLLILVRQLQLFDISFHIFQLLESARTQSAQLI